jgi:hypothetical protein
VGDGLREVGDRPLDGFTVSGVDVCPRAAEVKARANARARSRVFIR